MRRFGEVLLLVSSLAGCEKTTPTLNASPGTTSGQLSKNGTSMSALSFTKLRRKMQAPPISGSTSSFIVPGRKGDRILATVFLTSLPAPDLALQRSKVGTPFLVQTFDASTGELLRSKEVAAGDFGALPINKELGFEKLDERSDSDQLEARLYLAYDVLAPAYARGDTKLDAAGLIAATTCRQVFPKYAGPLLLPYYEYLARDFFAWLDKAAK
jgi:hypothetical protein